jgi:hypothetical protein
LEQTIIEGNESTELEPVEETEDEALKEFKESVEFLMQKIRDDPEIRDRLICETYVNIANMETAIRNTFTMFQNEGGPMAMMKMLFGRKGKNDGRESADSE